MSRNLTSALQTEFAKQGLCPIVLVQAQFTSGTIYVWSGIGTLSWNGHPWLGVGTLGSISTLSEGTEVEAQGIAIGLSGIPSDLILQILGECRPNAPVKVWLGAVDSAGAVIVDPYQSFSGRMDVPEIQEGAETCSVSIHVENRLIDLGRARERRWTHEDQKIDYPTDLGFEYVASLQEWNGLWGKQGVGIPVSAAPPGGDGYTGGPHSPGGGLGPPSDQE
jgi:hypothetical protein